MEGWGLEVWLWGPTDPPAWTFVDIIEWTRWSEGLGLGCIGSGFRPTPQSNSVMGLNYLFGIYLLIYFLIFFNCNLLCLRREIIKCHLCVCALACVTQVFFWERDCLAYGVRVLYLFGYYLYSIIFYHYFYFLRDSCMDLDKSSVEVGTRGLGRVDMLLPVFILLMIFRVIFLDIVILC